MKITGFKLAKVRVPLITPFKTALRTVTQIEDIILMIETDTGHIGYGEAPATAVITGDTHGSIIDALRLHILPAIVGMDTAQLADITAAIQGAIVHNTNAKAAAEIAVYDLCAQDKNQPLYMFLGGGEPRLTTDLTISVDNVDKMVADSLLAVKAGYKLLKIKVGKDINLDIERVKAIYAAIDGRSHLLLDANQGWTAEQTVSALDTLERAGVKLEMIEQPVKADDIDGMQFITQRVSTPVMADESAFNLGQVVEILERKAADIINIKLMKTGGLSNAIAIANTASTFGAECMIGCMLETSISVSAAAHFAVAHAHVITRIDLDGPALGAFDPVQGGTTFDGPSIVLGDGPGLGIKSITGLNIIDEA
jgi:o-succinylbenzoate synthase